MGIVGLLARAWANLVAQLSLSYQDRFHSQLYTKYARTTELHIGHAFMLASVETPHPEMYPSASS